MSEAANAPAPEIQIIETREGRILRLQEEGQTMDLAVLWDATLGMVAPAISEADLAGKLGLKRSRALGDLAKRVFGKKFNEIHVCRSVRRTGAVNRESTMRWYTETQALQLIMRSSAPNASAMQVDIARSSRWPGAGSRRSAQSMRRPSQPRWSSASSACLAEGLRRSRRRSGHRGRSAWFVDAGARAFLRTRSAGRRSLRASTSTRSAYSNACRSNC